ncbi:MAG TPA: hypothetical protein VF021_03595, partial [Longimicrobiales bacterium]
YCQSAMPRTPEIQRLSERMTFLAGAFRNFAGKVPGLRVDVVGYMADSETMIHPVAGFEVRLQREKGGAGVSLYISASYAELTRWTAKGKELRKGGALRERFDVDFEEEDYQWGESSFEEPEQLAHELLGYMQFNLDAVSGK